MFNNNAAQFLHGTNEASVGAMIRNTLLVLICFFSCLMAKQSIEPFQLSPIEFQNNSEMEFELNALRKTIPGEPGK